MLDFVTITAIADRIARNRVSKAGVERIFTEAATDSEGNDALRIILVLKPEAAQALSGDEALDLLVEVQKELRDEGEERFPIIEYATEQELGPEGDAGQEDPNEDNA